MSHRQKVLILEQKRQSGSYKFSKRVRGNGISIIAQRERLTFDNRKKTVGTYMCTFDDQESREFPSNDFWVFSWNKRQNYIFLLILYLNFFGSEFTPGNWNCRKQNGGLGRLLYMCTCIIFWHCTLQTVKNTCKNQK